jgi:hypothetical protein
MNKAIPIILLGAVTLAHAQQFQLKSPDGTLSAPIELKDGATLTVSNTTLTLVNVRTQKDKIREALQNIVIPAIDLRNASLQDAIAFLNKSAQEFDKQKRGVNLILITGTNAPSADANPPQTITLSARNITLLDTLNTLTTIAALKYRIADSTVIVSPRHVADDEIITRRYDCLPTVQDRISYTEQEATIGDDSSSVQTSQDHTWKRFFAQMGVPWPEGSAIKHIRIIGKLIVSNTRSNLEIFERVLATLRVEPSQIEVEVQFVAFDLAQVSKLGPTGATAAALTALWTNGLGTLIAAPRVITTAGAEATVKGVSEWIYPTNLAVCLTNSAAITNATSSSVPPAAFESREVGTLLTVLPDVSPEGRVINLTLIPELVEPPVWQDYSDPHADANSKPPQAHLPQPVFHTYTTSTSVMVDNGGRLLVGGGIPTRDGKRLVYTFLTARLIGIHGQAIDTKDDVGR